ncbi:MAG: ribonuclease III [Chlorobi bacterium]|nr:ribonuclease III [Chlorobiota bacterium]MCI0716958.1 ribonuclease III [Chlorobiota bacterium]
MFGVFKTLRKLVPLLRRRKEEDDIYSAIASFDFKSFQENIDYQVIHKNFFINALTHRSFLKAKGSNGLKFSSNERLEYLGDAILDSVVAEYLYKNFPDSEEGDLTKYRSVLVNQRFLAERAKEISLQKYLLAAPTALKSIEDGYDTILSDAYEALVGAIFLDKGYDASKEFLNNQIFKKLDVKWLNQFDENYKSKLLEYTQANTDFIPEYKVIAQEGPEHNKLFTVEVSINQRGLGIGKGRTKKQAEQEAASNALKNLDVIEKMGLKKKKKGN